MESTVPPQMTQDIIELAATLAASLDWDLAESNTISNLRLDDDDGNSSFQDYDYGLQDVDDDDLARFGEYPYLVDGSDTRPVGTYDPFNSCFPRSACENEWGIRACIFILESLQTQDDWDYMVESICEPFLECDGNYCRTRDWFNALEFDVQMEIWVQRNLGLRPGSQWILGPHDDQLPEWTVRAESGKCRIVDIQFPGSELGYVLELYTQQTLFDEDDFESTGRSRSMAVA